MQSFFLGGPGLGQSLTIFLSPAALILAHVCVSPKEPECREWQPRQAFFRFQEMQTAALICLPPQHQELDLAEEDAKSNLLVWLTTEVRKEIRSTMKEASLDHRGDYGAGNKKWEGCFSSV